MGSWADIRRWLVKVESTSERKLYQVAAVVRVPGAPDRRNPASAAPLAELRPRTCMETSRDQGAWAISHSVSDRNRQKQPMVIGPSGLSMVAPALNNLAAR